MFRRFVALAGVLSVVLVGVSGCSGQGQAGEVAPTTVSTTATSVVASEPVTEPVTVPPVEELYPYPKPEFPPEAHEHSVLGAQAFTVYAWQMFVYTVAVRDPEPFKRLCLPEIKGCYQTVDMINDLLETDSYYLGYSLEDLVVNGSMPGGDHPDAEWGTQLAAYNPEFIFYDGEANKAQTFERRHLIFAAEVVWNDGWKISDVGVEDYSNVYGN